MKCDSCDQKATVFYTQVTDGKMKKTALCAKCAEQQGITDPTGLMMADQLMTSGAPVAMNQAFPENSGTVPMSTECPSCGFTIDHYQKVGRLGCGDCYSTFAPEIEQRIPSLHKGFQHSGHVPAGLEDLEKKKSVLDQLEKKLSDAIAAEDYEEAARLRDELQAAAQAPQKEEKS